MKLRTPSTQWCSVESVMIEPSPITTWSMAHLLSFAAGR